MGKRNKGFALLYAILLSGALLLVGVILMNIITKQLVYSSINKKSEASYYYAANSGRECLMHYAINNAEEDDFDPSIPHFYNNADYSFLASNTFSCFERSITMTRKSDDGNKVVYETDSPVLLDDNKIDLKVTFNRACLDIDPLTLCEGDQLEDKNSVVAWSLGSSNTTGLRSTRRLAILVGKPSL